ncbi:MAG TPA: hypothetical protein VEA38_14735 [Terriglobales bacterium]|nr:hypothetical protein [Terriglobales bacterium]
MLVRYCAVHPGYFGYPKLLRVRWIGWRVATAGGLCEACRERERARWDASPYGEVLVPVPVELGPRMLGRRVIVAVVGAAAAATVVTAALLAVNPPDLIPSGGEPGLFSSGARLVEPVSAPAATESERPAASRPQPPPRAASEVVSPRVAHPSAHPTKIAVPVRTTSLTRETMALVRGCPATLNTALRTRAVRLSSAEQSP